jgi:hypothetical protein
MKHPYNHPKAFLCSKLVEGVSMSSATQTQLEALKQHWNLKDN